MADEQLTTEIEPGSGSSVSGDAVGVDATDGSGSADDASILEQPSQTVEAAPPAQPQGATGSGGQRPAPINVDAELQAKELLADKLQAGLIQYDEYAKALAVHDKRIVQAQRQEREALQETIRPIQHQRQVSDSNRRYFSTWGTGKDAASLKFGKTVPSKTAQALFSQAEAEVEADPLYQNRPEFDLNTVVRMKWMEKLDAASKKKPVAVTAQTTTAATQPQTRFSGNAGAGAQQFDRDTRTAKQKLDAGEYPGIVDETDSLMKGL